MPMRLLLADDPLIREGLKMILLREGFDIVAEAKDGNAAVNLSLEHRPDVIVMDIRLPDSGLEAIRRIVEERPNCRVMVLTDNDDENAHRAAEEAGASAYVLKSASTKEIAAAVRALGRGESLLDQPLHVSWDVQLEAYPGSNQPDGKVLTESEQKVLQLFANGKSTVEVARTLTISQQMVKNDLTSIFQKLNVRDRTEAVLSAVRMGIIKLERRTRPRI